MKTRAIPVLLILAACLLLLTQQPAQAANPALSGTSWLLSTLNGQLPVPGTSVTLAFDASNATGSDGCNRFATTYVTRGSTIIIAQPAATTMMACPQPVMSQATAYMQALAAADTFEVRNSQLTLVAQGRVVATFVAVRQDLVGTIWMVTGYNNGREAVVSPLLGADIMVTIDQDNQFQGNAGCNDFFGLYQASNGAVSISDVGSTMRFCPEPAGVMEQEAEFFAALESAATYSIQGDLLEMRTISDTIAVHMVRELQVPVPTPEPATPTGLVTANTLNIRSGPGTNFPVIGTLRYGQQVEIVGRSFDNRWWVIAVPSAPGGTGWVSADFVAARNVADVPVIAAPPPPIVVVPTPAPTPTRVPAPTATPGPQLSFTADRTTINQGECTTIRWNVANVQAVWVYPQGQPYHQFPRTGQGSEQVCPASTTTYEMRVLLRDGSVTTQRVTVNVTPAPVQNSLAGTTWQVGGYYVGGAVASPLSGTNPTVAFTSNQISGNTGCNSFNGSYSVSGTNINISSLGTGMKSCAEPPGIMQQEQQLIAALQSASNFQFVGNRLELRRGDGTLMVTMNRLQ